MPSQHQKKTGYIGRFAPTPSGPLHLGSLLAALASFLDARHHHGQWLVRIEDVDVQRAIPGCDTQILHTLDRFGLHWDGTPVYQSQRIARYEQVLMDFFIENQTKSNSPHLYPCTCTRKKLSSYPGVYPGFCKNKTLTLKTLQHQSQAMPPFCVRWHVKNERVIFLDRLFGEQVQWPCQLTGDPIVLRKDHFFSYYWSVVIDDWDQNITQIVRGNDLLNETGAQILLQQALGAPTPQYTHLPLITHPDGSKLSKSQRAASLKHSEPSQTLLWLLAALGQLNNNDLNLQTVAKPDEILRHAAQTWSLDAVPRGNILTDSC